MTFIYFIENASSRLDQIQIHVQITCGKSYLESKRKFIWKFGSSGGVQNYLKRDWTLLVFNFLVVITEKNVVEGEDNSFVHFRSLLSLDLSWIIRNKREGEGRRLFFKNLSLAKLVQFYFQESRITFHLLRLKERRDKNIWEKKDKIKKWKKEKYTTKEINVNKKCPCNFNHNVEWYATILFFVGWQICLLIVRVRMQTHRVLCMLDQLIFILLKS